MPSWTTVAGQACGLSNAATSTVKFTPVEIKRIGEETAFVTGIGIGEKVVALGAHLLENGAAVRFASQQEATK